MSAAVGDTCTPSSHEFSVTAINVEDQSLECGPGICLVARFEGNVSCPYGQAATGGDCVDASGEPVEGPVRPQLVSRPPSDAIYCSCRCAGPAGGDFCACPGGFECRELIQEFFRLKRIPC